MYPRWSLALLNLYALLLAPLSAVESPEAAPLFNGRDLSGWSADGHAAAWRVVNGLLVGESDEALTGSVLQTEAKYGDFVLEFDARWSDGADSGVFLREPVLQMQIGVSISLKVDRTCSFYTGGTERYPAAGRARDLTGILKPGDWNRIRLEARGDTFTVWLNGEQVTRFVSAKYPGPGRLGLQIHPKLRMKVEFRDVRIRARSS
jgi:hypothetical protein